MVGSTCLAVILPVVAVLAQAEPEISVTQAMLLVLAILLIFVTSAFATGFLAKKLSVFDANYGKAAWATVLKYVISATGVAVIGNYLTVGPTTSLVIVNVLLPIVIYKIVFQSTIVQAVLLWLAVLAAEVVAAVALVFGALSLGEYLDRLVGMPF